MKNARFSFFLVLLLVGGWVLYAYFRVNPAPLSVAPTSAGSSAIRAPAAGATYRILEKVKPGGYLGWHQTEKDQISNNPVLTRQASNHYFICHELETDNRVIFLVSEAEFMRQRVGNVLDGRDIAGYQRVEQVEEPPLPSEFEFRRRDRPASSER